MLLKYCFVLLFVLCAQAAKSQVISINEKDKVIINPTSVLWYLDKVGTGEFEKIRTQHFESFPQKQLLTSQTKWNVWAKFQVANTTAYDKEIVILTPKIGYANLYIQDSSYVTKLQTGSLLPLQKRSLPSSINGFRLNIGKGDIKTVWVQLNSRYSIYIPRNYSFQLMPETVFRQKDNQRMLWQGVFLGVILVMILYNLFVGIAVKDINYLYYVLSIAGIGTYFGFYYGFGIEYLWKNSPVW